MASSDTLQCEFALWKSESLRKFLSERGLPVDGSKPELVALCFAAEKMSIPTIPSREQTMKLNRERYFEKLTLLAIPDPLETNDGWIDEKQGMAAWPPTYIGDITCYLMKHLPVTECERHLNEYKVGKAYEYYRCGWLKEVFVKREGRKCVLRSKCCPSFSPKEDPYNIWACMQDSGEILAAYCSCTAGLGETCNHIAAMLFRVEAANRLGISACTSLPCVWDIPLKVDLTPTELSKMTIEKARYGKENTRPLSNLKRDYTPLKPPPLAKDSSVFDQMCNALTSVLPEACAFKGRDWEKAPTLKTNHPSSSQANATAAQPVLIFNVKRFILKEMIDRGESDNLTPADVEEVNKNTVGQGKNKYWGMIRQDRITSSNFYGVHTKMESGKKSDVSMTPVLSKILGYTKVDPNLKPLKHGRTMEPIAKTNYIKTTNRSTHTNVTYEECGVFIDSTRPYLAASPDLLVSCDCCGKGVVEFKCPMISKCSVCNKFCTCIVPSYLQKLSDGHLQLRKCHTYYCQIQGQMAITNRSYCDFVVYTCNGVHQERIYFKEPYYTQVLNNLCLFYDKYLLPEIVSPSLNSTVQDSSLQSDTCTPVCTATVVPTFFCPTCRNIIKEEEYVQSFQDKSICCEMCDLWYHFKCVKLTQKKASKLKDWICPGCSNTTL